MVLIVLFLLGIANFALHKAVLEMPGCDGGNVKYLMGHTHCNKKMTDGRGYLIGASGAGWGPSGPQPDNPCPDVGFVYFDSTRGREELTLFTVWDNSTSHVAALRSCFADHGIGQCTHLGTVWTNTSFVDL